MFVGNDGESELGVSCNYAVLVGLVLMLWVVEWIGMGCFGGS